MITKLFIGLPKPRRKAMRGGQHNLGVMYYEGTGVSQDYKQAAHWFTKAAEQGPTAAQYNLGLMYERGLGVPKNYKKAYMWISLAINDETEGGQEIIDRVKENLSFEDLLEAQDMARRCRNSGYKDC